MAEKYFSREEAEQILPQIKRRLEQARQHKLAVDRLDQDLGQAAARIMVLGGSLPPYQEMARKRAEREQFVLRVQETINKIQEMGAVVKDLEEGLVDFPSLRRGEEVYLCWKLGEQRIGYWHGLEEGFAGRKPLDEEPGEDEEASGGPSRIQ